MEVQFEHICSRLFYSGLLVAMVTDRDGVIILKCVSEKAKENMTGPIIPSTFAIANNQASKLGLQHNKSIISVFDEYQIIQLDQSPFTITLIAESDANTGLFINLGDDLLNITKPLVEAINNEL
ncbi:Ragulator complex protein LAMTOR3 [Cokeromyces recurvatus]|uniref:Ragulator complex protein LAMTOR3 n=1 Tax=Cokeromyces recurvatus TaxID=90255 RepID=UPI00221EB055|nr:Ragulator complex protein LAMTOR3 [Cokeromyces recurvatus]KAI7908217.1 Ragulator complex protein LAMTOR3 [Cokeromyces recurvatus]